MPDMFGTSNRGLLRYARSVAIKAVFVDDSNTHHLVIGLNRDNVDSILRGDVFTLPGGVAFPISEQSDIVVLFAETDKELEKRFPAKLRPG